MSFVNAIYDRTLRPYLPRKFGVHNGIVARRPRLLDRTDVWPTFKRPYLQAIEKHTSPGDVVIEVGAGWGIATTAAARAAGVDGQVTAFEPAPDRAAIAEETVLINGVADTVTVRQAAIGDLGEAPINEPDDVVAPADLPPGDVLQLDCEGAERHILDSVGQRGGYGVIIATAHTCYGVTVQDLQTRLSEYMLECVRPTVGDAESYVTVFHREGGAP